MKGKIIAVYFDGKGNPEEKELSTSNLLEVNFTGEDGKAVTVEIRQGNVIVSVEDGRLAVLPIASNSARVMSVDKF